MNAPNGGKVTFYYKNSNSGKAELFKVGYSTTDNAVSSFTWGDEMSKSNAAWEQYEGSFPAGTKYVAVYYYSNYQYYLYVDDFSFTAAASGPALEVADGSTSLSSGCSYNFGLTTAGTTKEFKLSNPGTESITLNIEATNGFGVSPTSTTIAAKGEETLTVTMANTTASGAVTITPEENVDPFTINVSGTVRDPNKVYLDFANGQMPEGWTQEGYTSTGYYSTTYEWTPATGYIGYSFTSSTGAGKFISPKLNFENGETIIFETQKYSNSAYYLPSVTVEYTTDATGATGWTAIGSAYTDDTDAAWTQRSVIIPVENVKRIRFNGWYIKLRNIYGGELPNEPKMSITEPTNKDFGLVDNDAAAPTRTFTIANTGKATMSGIEVTSSNDAFTITNAPTSLASNASQEVTITMPTGIAGAKSATITISATGLENATFGVSGCVKPAGMPIEDFASGLPANWTNASWTFANGEATGKSSSAYLTTPKLNISAGDFIIVKAKRYDSDTSDYLTVQGSSDNGSTWTAYSKKLQNADGLTYPDYGTMVLSDIPTTVNKIRFVGFYAIIDEIYGLNYAASLSVTTGSPVAAVSSPANYDFGDCKKDESVTYHFTNAGAGTINITGIEITGDGKDAYSTNWTTSVAAPFDLVISRTYDSNRAGAGAQEAAVTVTTSEGNFVINVTGTDWAPITEFPWTENFNGITSGIPTRWDNSEGTTTNDSYKWSSYSTGYDGKCLRFDSYYNSDGNTNFLKTPIMNLPAGKDMQLKFWYNNPAGGDFSVYISNDGGATYETALATGLTGVTDWTEKSISIPSGYTDNVVIVFKGTSNCGSSGAYIDLDDVTVQEQEDGANFAINTDGSAQNFGNVKGNTTAEKTYTITNSGNENLEVTFTDATDFKVVKGTTEPWNNGKLIVPAKNGEADGTASFTIKMVTDGTYGDKSGNVVLNFTALNATSFTIPCTGNVKDPNVLEVDFEDGSFPAGWQVGANWSVASTSGNYYAVQSQTSLANASAFVTTPLTFAENETLTFKVMRNLTGSSSYKKSLKVRYSTDGGVNWSAYKDYGDEFGASFAQYELTDVPAGTVIVEFFGNNIKIDDIQGVKNATKPAMALTENDAAVVNGSTKAFENLKAEGTATYTLKNIGNDNMVSTVAITGGASVTISGEGEGVTISDKTVTLAVGKSATITLTVPFEAPYSDMSGAMTIATEGWVGDFAVNYTATLVDPTNFVEDFTSGKPAGWYNGGWTIGDGSAFVNSGVEKQLITEMVAAEASTGKNVLSFKAKMYYDYETGDKTLNVYTSTDRMNWTLRKECTLTDALNYQNFSLEALADGNYYVMFEAANARIDDILGLKRLEAPEHDLYITSSSFPVTTTKGNSATISATVTSLIAAETGVYAKLFINGVQEGDASAAQGIALNGTKTFSFTYAIPENKTAQIKVYYSDHTEAFATAENDMKVNYTFDEEVDPSTITAGTFDVTLNRSFVEGWNTICLPFAVTDIEGVFGDGVKIYGFDSKNGDNLRFTSVDETEAGTPYLIKMPAAKSDAIVMNNVSVSDAAAGTVEQSSIILHGSYAPMAAGTLTGCYGVNSENQIAPANEYTIMKGFRAYFSGSVAGARISIFDETTGITTVYGADKLFGNDNRIYNLKGQHVENAKKGIYIVNGKKVVIK